MSEAVKREIEMRAACVCGGVEGFLEEKNGQDTVRCCRCGRFQYNASRVETGREIRSTDTVHDGIKAKQRVRILMRDHSRCVVCGNRGNLHVSHFLSVAEGLKLGLTETQLNDDENLAACCDRCNLGMSKNPMPLWLITGILATRVKD